MADRESKNHLFPELGDSAQIYLDHEQTRTTEQANHALRLLEINLLIASVLIAAPVLTQIQGLNQFQIIIVNFYTLGGVIFWLLSVGAATSAFISSRASLNPVLTVFDHHLKDEFSERQFRELLSFASSRSKQTSGECFWLLTISLSCSILAVYFFGLSILDSLFSISIAYIDGLWPLLALGLIGLIPSGFLGLLRRYRPNIIHLSESSENLAEPIENEKSD